MTSPATIRDKTGLFGTLKIAQLQWYRILSTENSSKTSRSCHSIRHLCDPGDKDVDSFEMTAPIATTEYYCKEHQNQEKTSSERKEHPSPCH